MKKALLFLFVLATASVLAQPVTTKTGFIGTFTFTNFSAGGTADVQGDLTAFNDQTNQYFANNIQVGDVCWDNQGKRWEVMVVNSSNISQANVDLRAIDGQGGTPFGIGFVNRETPNVGLSLFPPDNNIGISQQLKSRVESHNALVIDEAIGNVAADGNGIISELPTGPVTITAAGPLTINGYDAYFNGIRFGKGGFTGVSNLAITGGFSFSGTSSGQHNTVIGYDILSNTNTVSRSVIIGNSAMKNTTSNPSDIVAIGYEALRSVNGGGGKNVALGVAAMYTTTTGNSSVAVGFQSLYTNTTGFSNVAVGYEALRSSTTGSGNVSVGSGALRSMTTGEENTAVGTFATYSGTTYNNTTAIGYGAQPTASNQVVLGDNRVTQLISRNYKFNIDQTVGAGQDGYVLKYNNSGGEIELQPSTGDGNGIISALPTGNVSIESSNDLTINQPSSSGSVMFDLGASASTTTPSLQINRTGFASLLSSSYLQYQQTGNPTTKSVFGTDSLSHYLTGSYGLTAQGNKLWFKARSTGLESLTPQFNMVALNPFYGPKINFYFAEDVNGNGDLYEYERNTSQGGAGGEINARAVHTTTTGTTISSTLGAQISLGAFFTSGNNVDGSIYFNTAGNSTSADPRLSIQPTGTIRFHNYTNGSKSGTANRWLAVTTSGDVIEVLAPTNLYTASGTLTSARTVTMGANDLTFSGSAGSDIFMNPGGVISFYGNYRFPTAAPTNGQVLRYAGAANNQLEWGAITGDGNGILSLSGTGNLTGNADVNTSNFSLNFKRLANSVQYNTGISQITNAVQIGVNDPDEWHFDQPGHKNSMWFYKDQFQHIITPTYTTNFMRYSNVIDTAGAVVKFLPQSSAGVANYTPSNSVLTQNNSLYRISKQTGASTFSHRFEVDIQNDVVRLPTYGSGRSFAAATGIMGTDNSGDLVRVDPSSLGDGSIYLNNGTISTPRTVTLTGATNPFDIRNGDLPNQTADTMRFFAGANFFPGRFGMGLKISDTYNNSGNNAYAGVLEDNDASAEGNGAEGIISYRYSNGDQNYARAATWGAAIGKSGIGELLFNAASTIFTDNRAGGSRTGIQYAADYSADFDNRSLVDRGYVDKLSGKRAVTTASTNGSGQLTIAHGVTAYTPDWASSAMWGANSNRVNVISVDATNIVLEVRDNAGATVNSTSVTVSWEVGKTN